jgi:hypothetical protein
MESCAEHGAWMQVKVEVAAVRNDGMVHAATFQKDAQVLLTVIQVPPQLRRLEFARTSPSGDPLCLQLHPILIHARGALGELSRSTLLQ